MAKLRPVLILAVAAVVASCNTIPAHMPNAAYYMGETFLRRGELDKAVEAYRVFITDPGPNPDIYLPRAYYMLAFAYYRQGRYEDALNTLDELERRYPEADSVQVWTLRGDTSRELQNRVQAVQEYDEAWRFSGQMDRVRLETRISRTVKDMSVEELTQAEQLVSDPVLHALVAKQLVDSGGSLIAADDQAALANNDAMLAAAPLAGEPIKRTEERREARARELERRQARLHASEEIPAKPLEPVPIVPVPAPEPPEPEPEPLAVAVAPTPSGPGKVVCLAPLSGPDLSIGRKVCDSVTSAFGSASEQVVTQDSGETAGEARGAWMTAIEDPSVVAAVAWLPHESIPSVATMAETAGVPLILVSSGAGNEGRYVRAWGPGRSAEMNGLASYMVDVVRVRRFGVFYPDTTAGNDYLDRFSAAVRSGGGQVVGKQVYRTGNLDETSLLETLKKWRKRDVNVDAVLVPDQLANVEALVTRINQQYPDVIVLGLSSWNTSTAPLKAFIASGADTSAFDAGSALYGAVVGGGANTRLSVEERLRHVDANAVSTTSPPTILHLQNGEVEKVGG